MKKMLMMSLMLVLMIGLASAICIDLDDPTQPGNFVVGDSPYDADGNVVLSWSAASDTPTQSECPLVPIENLGVDFYEVYMGEVADFPMNSSFLLGTTDGLSYPVNGLTQGLTYYFKVRAVDHAGNVGGAVLGATTIGNAPGGGGGGSVTVTRGGGGGGGGVVIQQNTTPEILPNTTSETAELTVQTAQPETSDTEEVNGGEETPVEEPADEGDGGLDNVTGGVTGLLGNGRNTLGFIILILTGLLLFILLFRRKKKQQEYEVY